MSKLARLLAGLRGRLESLPLPALLAIGVLIAAGTSAGGYYGYQAYDYVEHDNQFCFSCHLMQEPYELFAESAHRGLGCKACHQPNLLERSQMGLTAIIENPDSIAAHAPVPNGLCADCHINGDPERWTLVASSAGHRVHLESEDSVLAGLQCVECHSSSLHEFAAVDRTCAQSGCHEDSDVQLGAMSDLTIHCVACHSFNAPITTEGDPVGTLAPDESTCLSCHVMRTLVELPDPDPHEAECASCHNPHEQATPAEAGASCATTGCHTDPVDLSPFHQGLEEPIAEDCLYCHQAHDFHVDGSNCLSCHPDIMEDEPAAVRISAQLGVRAMHADVLHSWAMPVPQLLDFLHSEHPSVDCTDCHETTEAHGTVTVTTISDCRSCHHEGEQVSGADVDGCATCHVESGSLADPYPVSQTLSFSTGTVVERSLPFDHGPHAEEDCATCHTEGLELSVGDVECASCHVEHHELQVDCMSCHIEAPEGSHTIESAHVTCSGAGCHEAVPFEGVPRTNPVCLGCHQDLVDHRPGGECAECHALPEIGGHP